jgi:gliding motility associated protien GldN
MKRAAFLILSFCFPAFMSLNAQSVLGDQPLDGVYKREHITTRKPIPYAPLREADVTFKRRVWRVLDLREKINLPLYFPIRETNGMRSLADLLYRAVTEEVSLRVYSNGSDDFSVEVTPTEVRKITNKTYERTVPSLIDPSIDSTVVITEEFSPSRVKKFLIKEEWFFDRQRSVLDVRILGICPLYENEDKDKGDTPLFWIYFPEARTLLAQYDIFNRSNPAERRSFDDMFWKRQFSSYIVKEENVYDRSINEYKKGMDALLESQRIKEEIINFEHDLWEF